jgi:tryptophan-rich sensory protein
MDPAVWLPATAAIAFWSAVAVAGALVTDIGPWYRALRQPWWKPPDALFGPIWTTVFVCTGTGGVIAWRGGGTPGERRAFLVACLINALGNVWWSWLFFRRRRPDWALRQVVPFWCSIFLMYWTTRPLAYTAGIWFAPYLGWVAIATYLNWTVVKLNGPFHTR